MEERRDDVRFGGVGVSGRVEERFGSSEVVVEGVVMLEGVVEGVDSAAGMVTYDL